ncbi:IS5 family transposase [Spirochaetia bacterium]|nr:IS5 family transposase [Spirochaetia bacterium]GHU32148.1 IS5 family transposase [Spirochaetia bacterium]
MIINRENRNILDIREAAGSVHDFKLFKNTIGKTVDPSVLIQADSGYLGIGNLHANSQIPKKESKYHKLSKEELAYNKRLSRERVVIEHINAKIKTFKNMAYPYRNHCTRHLLRMSLICGIINFELRI